MAMTKQGKNRAAIISKSDSNLRCTSFSLVTCMQWLRRWHKLKRQLCKCHERQQNAVLYESIISCSIASAAKYAAAAAAAKYAAASVQTFQKAFADFREFALQVLCLKSVHISTVCKSEVHM